MIHPALLVIATLLVAASAVLVSEGDLCGIHGADFLDDSFGGTNAVAGPGCTLADGSTNCYCASVKDGDPLGEWEWHCNTADETKVDFGPVEGKTCPESIPVPKEYDSDQQPPCDTALHPTGLAGDPSCGYDDCAEGGDNTAVCGCVDLDLYGIPGGGKKWFCLHSTCSSDDGYCGTPDGGGDDTTSAAGSGRWISGVSTGGVLVASVLVPVLMAAV